MTDEKTQPENALPNEQLIERRSAVTDAAEIVVPLLPVAYEIGKDIWGAHQEQKPDPPPEIILPPGAEKDSRISPCVLRGTSASRVCCE
jgi:hypothetical protein